MTTANDRQVGGSHYKAAQYEHWDFAIDVNLPYLEGQVTKYVDRHERKNKRQDLEKALHFAEKLYEAWLATRVGPGDRLAARAVLLSQFLDARPNMSPNDALAITRATLWSCTRDLLECISAIKSSIVQFYGPLENAP